MKQLVALSMGLLWSVSALAKGDQHCAVQEFGSHELSSHFEYSERLISSEAFIRQLFKDTQNLASANSSDALELSQNWICYLSVRRAHSVGSEWLVQKDNSWYLAFDSYGTGNLHIIKLLSSGWGRGSEGPSSSLVPSRVWSEQDDRVCEENTNQLDDISLPFDSILELGIRVDAKEAQELIAEGYLDALSGFADETRLNGQESNSYFLNWLLNNLMCFGRAQLDQPILLLINNENLAVDEVFNASGIISIDDSELERAYFWYLEQS